MEQKLFNVNIKTKKMPATGGGPVAGGVMRNHVIKRDFNGKLLDPILKSKQIPQNSFLDHGFQDMGHNVNRPTIT